MCEGIAENGRFRVVETVETQGRRKLLNDRPSFENPGHEAALSTLRMVRFRSQDPHFVHVGQSYGSETCRDRGMQDCVGAMQLARLILQPPG